MNTVIYYPAPADKVFKSGERCSGCLENLHDLAEIQKRVILVHTDPKDGALSDLDPVCEKCIQTWADVNNKCPTCYKTFDKNSVFSWEDRRFRALKYTAGAALYATGHLVINYLTKDGPNALDQAEQTITTWTAVPILVDLIKMSSIALRIGIVCAQHLSVKAIVRRVCKVNIEANAAFKIRFITGLTLFPLYLVMRMDNPVHPYLFPRA